MKLNILTDSEYTKMEVELGARIMYVDLATDDFLYKLRAIYNKNKIEPEYIVSVSAVIHFLTQAVAPRDDKAKNEGVVKKAIKLLNTLESDELYEL